MSHLEKVVLKLYYNGFCPFWSFKISVTNCVMEAPFHTLFYYPSSKKVGSFKSLSTYIQLTVYLMFKHTFIVFVNVD